MADELAGGTEREGGRHARRAAVGLAVTAVFLLGWVNGAVGIIGSENQPANLMYFGVLLIALIGAGMTRLRPHQMAVVMWTAALAQLMVPVVALMVWGPELSWGGAGMIGVFIMNGVFASLFIGSAVLFRRSSQGRPGWGGV